MRILKITSRVLLVLLAVCGLYMNAAPISTSTIAAATTTTAATTASSTANVDDPCDCEEGRELALQNAENDFEGCDHNMQIQLDACLSDASFAAEDAFYNCMDNVGWESQYFDWCGNLASNIYANQSTSCYNTYYNYLLPYCETIYDRAVDAAEDGYDHCICNCPFLDPC